MQSDVRTDGRSERRGEAVGLGGAEAASAVRVSRGKLGRTTIGVLACAFVSVALAGCADLSFKPGATPGEIERDELACREAAGEDEAAYASCMKERGYLVSKTGEGIGWEPASR